MSEGAKKGNQARNTQARSQTAGRKQTSVHTQPQGGLLDLQRTAGNSAVARLIGTGNPLDPATRSFMEERFQYDFSTVRVHAGAQAAQAAKSMDALAFTAGRDVVFEPGAYAPETGDGQRLLAHELAHVVQQSRGGAAPDPWSTTSSIELDAERASKDVLQPGRLIHVSAATGPGIARNGKEKKLEPAALASAPTPPKTYTIEELLEPPTLEEVAQYTADLHATDMRELRELQDSVVKEMQEYKGAQSMNIWQVAVIEFTKDGRRYVTKGVFDGKNHAEKNALEALAKKVPKANWARGRMRMVVSKENCTGCQGLLEAEARKHGVQIETFVPVLPDKPPAPGQPQELHERDIGKSAVDRATRLKKLSNITLSTDRTYSPGEKPDGRTTPEVKAGGQGPAKAPMALTRRTNPKKISSTPAPPGPGAGRTAETPAVEARAERKSTVTAKEPVAGAKVEDHPPAAGKTTGRFSMQAPGIDPFRHAESVGQGSLWLLEALHALAKHFAEREQREKLQRRWEEERPKMEEFLQKGQGIMVWAEYTQHSNPASADSSVTPPLEFVDLSWQPGTRHQKAPDTVRGAGQSAVLEPTYIAPPKEAAKQLNQGAIETRLADLWNKQKTLQSSSERMSREWFTGRFMRRRAQSHIELRPVYDARSELASASTAVKQGRLEDAAASMNAAEKFLDEMWKNIVAYRGKATFDD